MPGDFRLKQGFRKELQGIPAELGTHYRIIFKYLTVSIYACSVLF